MKTLHVHAGGGLGDFIYTYFKDYSWRRIASVKATVDCRIVAVLSIHNPSCCELIYTNPYIDSYLLHPWYPPGHSKERDWKHIVAGSRLEDWARRNNIQDCEGYHKIEQKIHLTDKEQLFLDKIKEEKFIVIHPFAGLPHRGCLPHPLDGEYKCFPDYKYIQSANALAEEGYNVIFIGKTSFDGTEEHRNYEEGLAFPKEHMHPNVKSLINKISCRMNVELCRSAAGFMGTHSSMLSAAWTSGTPSVFFYPCYDEHGNHRSVTEYGGTTGTWALDEPQNAYFQMRAEDFLSLDYRTPVQKLMSLIK